MDASSTSFAALAAAVPALAVAAWASHRWLTSDRDAPSNPSAEEVLENVLELQEQALERIERLRGRLIIAKPDISKYSERLRQLRQQGDGLGALHATLSAATRSSSSSNLQLLLPGGSADEAARRRSASVDEGPRTPRNLATRTLFELQAVIGLTPPAVLAELAALAETESLRKGEELLCCREGAVPGELLVVASGSFVSSTPGCGGGEEHVVLSAHGVGAMLTSSLAATAALAGAAAAITIRCVAQEGSEVLRLPLTEQVSALIGRQLLRVAAIRTERVALFTMAKSLGLSHAELQSDVSPTAAADAAAAAAVSPPPPPVASEALAAVAAALDVEISALPEVVPAERLAAAERAEAARLQALHETGSAFGSQIRRTAPGQLQAMRSGLLLLRCEDGEAVAAAGDKPDLFVVVGGGLRVLAPDGRCLLLLGPGEAFGLGLCLLGEAWPLTVSVVADSGGGGGGAKTTLVRVSPPMLQQLFHTRSSGSAPGAATVSLARLRPLVWQIEAACDFVGVAAGDVVASADEEISHLTMVVSGRLRGVEDESSSASTQHHSVAELTSGDTLGLSELVIGGKLKGSWRAVRDSNLARLPASLFHLVCEQHPSIFAYLCRMTIQDASRQARDSRQSGLSVPHTVALIATGADVPLAHCADVLGHAIRGSGRTAAILDSGSLEAALGTRLFDTFGESTVTGFLNNQEEAHDHVLYVAKQQPGEATDPWTLRCARQADLVLFVENAHSTRPEPSPLELEISRNTNARQELVLLHFDPGKKYVPKGTKRFLTGRAVQRHHHIRVHTEDTAGAEAGVRYDRDSPNSDFARLARWITGTSVGLVLGGGGARGCSHFGAIRALEEAGVPIDMVGGTSIGSFVSGLRAGGQTNSAETTERGRTICRILGSYWGYLRDSTLPLVSFFSGSVMNSELRHLFGEDTAIEDLWLPTFVVTTNVTQPERNPMVHKNGRVWRYVRASMSLQGYLPPLCDTDPLNGKVNLLMDGGYVSNLPVETMRQAGAAIVIAVNVAGVSDSSVYDYGDALSGWWWLWQKVKYRPFFMPMPWSHRKPRVLTMGELSAELTYTADALRTASMLDQGNRQYLLPDLLLRPRVSEYGLLEFQSFDEIVAAGHSHVAAVLELIEELGDDTLALRSTEDPRAVGWDGSRVLTNPAGAAAIARLFLRPVLPAYYE